MINFEKLERRLRVLSKRQNFIKSNKTITYSELQKLNEISKTCIRRYMSECIEGEVNGEWDRSSKPKEFCVEIKCKKCGEIFTAEQVSKDRLLSYIYEDNFFLSDIFNTCQKCLEAEKQEKERKQALFNSDEEKQKRNEIRLKNTENYILNFLNPERCFEKGVKTFVKFSHIKQIDNCFEDQIVEYIQNMEYSDFLQTAYWDAIRSQKLYLSRYKCSLCDDNQNLQVHHKTYEHHGYEHIYLDDLIVLCGRCHSKHHGKGGN